MMIGSELPVRGRGRFHIPAKVMLFILTLVSVGLIIVTFRTSLFSGIFNTVAGGVVVPFQRGITSVATFMTKEAERLESLRALQQENEELKERIDALTTENTNLQQDKYELAELRALYNLDAEYEQYTKTAARIIAKDAGNWYHSFLIDKGSKDGLMLDMNVIAGSGLVGRIVSIGDDWAKVQSIIADNSSVSGMVLSTSDNLIVDGDLEHYAKGLIRFSKLIDNADKVTIGEKIVTSNVSDKYLSGILIGYINTISNDTNNLTKSGYLTPAVDFEHLNTVLVIMQLKKSGGAN